MINNREKPLKVALLGAECTGKTTLACKLATHYKTNWVCEYLREFVTKQGRTPNVYEQIQIAETQLANEDACFKTLLQGQKFLFCDTTPLMIWLYSQYYFGIDDDAIMQLVMTHTYAITLVCTPDVPWIADGLQRESDGVRQQIHQQLILTLKKLSIPYYTISGPLDKRLEQAIKLLL